MHPVVSFDNIWSNMELYQFVQDAMIEVSTPDSLAFGVITARFWFVDIYETDCFILNTKIHVITSDFNATSVVATRTWWICHWMLLSQFDTIDGCVRVWCRPTNQYWQVLLVLIVLLLSTTHPKDKPGMQIWVLDKPQPNVHDAEHYILIFIRTRIDSYLPLWRRAIHSPEPRKITIHVWNRVYN